jgi:hypothetical protein
MKKIIFFVFIILFGFSVNITLAQTLMPFGGQIITAPTPGVACPAGAPGSPFSITPIVSPPGLYVGDYNPISTRFRIVPGAWVLGLYIPVPIPECATTSTPPVPVTGFRTFLHGTSVSI